MARRKRETHLKEYVEAILVAVVIAVILRMFVVQAYRVSSGSMENSLLEGDFVFVNKLAYRFAEPQINDVIVFEFPMNTTKDYIKRIVALPGQTVEIRNKQLYVDSQMVGDVGGIFHKDSQVLQEVYSQRDFFGPLTVPSNQYFVMGDNRDDSQDSRFWGCLDRSHIKGRAGIVYFSWAPDSDAPTIGPPYVFDLFASFFYNLIHFPSRIRWERLFHNVE